MKRFLSFSFAIIFLIMFVPKAYANGETIMRIGLYYGNSAIPAANLQNYVGSGYMFGYFDSSRSFVELGYTAVTKISMLKDTVMYRSGGEYSESSGETRVGAYHIDSGNSFYSFEDALFHAESFKMQGIPAFPAYISGEYRVRIEHYSAEQYAYEDISNLGIFGGSTVGGSSSCITVVNTDTAEILFEFDSNSSNYLGIMPLEAGNGKAQTWFKGYKYYGGFEYKRMSGNNITVVNYVGIEDYVKGVIPYEMSPTWPTEALKAQAVCARTFAVSRLNKHSSSGFDLCNGIDCQVYRGTNSATYASDTAVEECAGLYATHEGSYIQTVYHSSNGGSTENAENIWGENIPYLRAVPDNFEDLQKATNGIWSFQVTNSQLTSILREKGYSVSSIRDAYVEEYTPAGNVLKLTFVDTSGQKYIFQQERARTILNNSSIGITIHSQRFYFGNSAPADIYALNGDSVNREISSPAYIIGAGGEISTAPVDVYIMSASGTEQFNKPTPAAETNGVYSINGRGWGHNVGMSQWGARGMSEAGYDFEWILKYYYTGITIR